MDIREHLMSRGMDPDRPGVLLSEEKCIATFLLYNLSGVLCGYQQYNPSGDKKLHQLTQETKSLAKYYTYVGYEGDPNKGERRLGVWGLETVMPWHRAVFVCEGIFDAVKLHNAGVPAIAVLANNPKPLKAWLKALGKTVVAIMDDDDAGSKLRSVADLSFTPPGEYNDLGDTPQGLIKPFIDGLGITW